MSYLSFQLNDIVDEDENTEDEDSSNEKNYLIHLFGRSALTDKRHPDKSVCLTLEGFEPHFYLRVSDESFNKARFTDWLKNVYEIADITVSAPFQSKDFDGFRGNKPSWFVKISSKSRQCIKGAAASIANVLKLEIKLWIPRESTIDDATAIYNTKFPNIPVEDQYLGPKGDKNRLLRLRFSSLEYYQKACRIEYRKAKREYFETFQRISLLRYETELRENKSIKLYGSNLDIILRFMHISGIRGTSWVSAHVNAFHVPDNGVTCDLEGRIHWRNLRLDEVMNKTMQTTRFRILSYDIETMSSDPLGGFPQAKREGDAIIQIGMTFNYYHQSDCYKRILLSLKSCDPFANCDVKSYEDEGQLLQAFIEIMKEEDPDVITGYNILGFDNQYMKIRAERHGLSVPFSYWGRLGNECRFREKELSSSALGDNKFFYYDSPGRVQIDLLKVIQRDHNLPTYKLDNVASHFNQNKVEELFEDHFVTKDTDGLEEESYFSLKVIEKGSGVEDELEEKHKITKIDGDRVYFYGGPIDIDMSDDVTIKWCMVKDDLPAKKIFEWWPQDSAKRAIIGKYCVKDCLLVNFLMEKLDILSNNMAMANVCFVPLRYIFFRGQGIKSLSLVAEQCYRDGYLIPAIEREDYTNMIWKQPTKKRLMSYGDNTSSCTFERCEAKGCLAEYEGGVIVCESCWRIQYDSSYIGAKVIDPKPGIYWSPIAVLDYASLYPSSIISKNMSWETVVEDPSYDKLEGYDYHEVSYTEGNNNKEVVCRFAQPQDGTYGVIPRILKQLLQERSMTKKHIKSERDQFKRKILDGHQLALKITANSLYGQLGALTSAIYKKSLAACTTSVGQSMLSQAQTFIETQFVPMIESLPDEHWVKEIIPFQPKVIYGDTDSIFISFNLRDDIESRQKRDYTIRLGILASDMIRPLLAKPQELEYEKTFHPFIVLCKKKYAGHKYETNPDSYVVSHMGIVLKRRDNAKIVKKVCGGILQRMLTESSSEKVINFTKNMLKDIINEKFGLHYFITTKRLRALYVNPDSIVHAKLAKRMTERDPGSAPQVNDRISYVNVYKPEFLDNNKLLQGDKVEELNYVRENNLKVDYLHYITNQIMIPACQFLCLLINSPEKTIFQPIIEETLKNRRAQKSRKIHRQFHNWFGSADTSIESRFTVLV